MALGPRNHFLYVFFNRLKVSIKALCNTSRSIVDIFPNKLSTFPHLDPMLLPVRHVCAQAYMKISSSFKYKKNIHYNFERLKTAPPQYPLQ